MFLHLGGDYVISNDQVVVILDYELRSHSKITRNYVETCQEQGLCRDISEGNPKSVIVTTTGVYFSQISPATLKKRAHSKMAELGNYLR